MRVEIETIKYRFNLIDNNLIIRITNIIKTKEMRVNNHHTNHQNAYQQNYAATGNSSGTRESQGDQRAAQTANHGQRSRSNGDQSGKYKLP